MKRLCELSLSAHQELVTKLVSFRAQVFSMLKILMSYFQVLVTFKTFSVPWPAFFLDFLSSLAIVNLGLGQILTLDCMRPETNFYDQLLLMTLTPILLLLANLAWFLLRCKASRQVTGHELNRLKAFHLKLTILLLFVVYPGTSTTIMQTLKCR